MHRPPPAARRPPSAAHRPPSAVRRPPSAARRPPPAARRVWSVGRSEEQWRRHVYSPAHLSGLLLDSEVTLKGSSAGRHDDRSDYTGGEGGDNSGGGGRVAAGVFEGPSCE